MRSKICALAFLTIGLAACGDSSSDGPSEAIKKYESHYNSSVHVKFSKLKNLKQQAIAEKTMASIGSGGSSDITVNDLAKKDKFFSKNWITKDGFLAVYQTTISSVVNLSDSELDTLNAELDRDRSNGFPKKLDFTGIASSTCIYINEKDIGSCMVNGSRKPVGSETIPIGSKVEIVL